MQLTYRLDIGKSISKGIFALIFLSSFSVYGAWPEKPIKIIVPFIPGGAADSAIRAMAPGLQKRLEQPIVIENKSGAGATMGTAAVASSPADGYTLLVGSASNAIGNAIQALTKAIEDTLKDEEIKRVLFKLGIEAMPGSASVLRERVSSDSRRWEKVIKNRKMELQ